ncbi:MAG: gliding motility lipoprotein GldH [Flavobacteriales bacterium]|nr:gliding motility lipoprotein GldH [Bacteroidota bacterium]MCB9240756.1 gliding motility lipoprotein GldH [Flavobacteriales bacterium]
MTVLYGCVGQTVLDQTEEIPNESWNETDTLSETFQIGDTAKEYHLDLTMRFNTRYPYANFYVWSELIKPSGERDTLLQSFDVTDKAGKWLGSGYGDLHSYEFPIYPQYTTNQAGTYTIRMVQGMRKKELDGCTSRGIRVKKGRDKF